MDDFPVPDLGRTLRDAPAEPASVLAERRRSRDRRPCREVWDVDRRRRRPRRGPRRPAAGGEGSFGAVPRAAVRADRARRTRTAPPTSTIRTARASRRPLAGQVCRPSSTGAGNRRSSPPLGAGSRRNLGCCTAAMLERPERHELDEVPRRRASDRRLARRLCRLPPYFDAAEELLAVCGAPTRFPRSALPAPLRAPPMSRPETRR